MRNIMNINGNEKQYYDKIVVLYNKYGENIPDADLMHLSVIEKELGISFKRSQELFELVKNHSESEINALSATEKTEEVKAAADIENNANVSEDKKTIETPKINSTSIDNKSTMETTTSYVEPLVEDSETQNMEKPTQPVNIKECTLDGGNMDLLPVDDPGDINKWKVIFFYTIGFLTIILWGIGLIIIIWETVAIIRHKNKQLKYAKYLIQRDQRKQ